MEKYLFLLLRLGLKTTIPEDEDCSALRELSSDQWNSLAELANFQGVAGVAMDGLAALINRYGREYFDHFENDFWSSFVIGWGLSVHSSLETINSRQLDVIADVQSRFSENGIHMMIMKGQAMAIYYPNPIHRSPGDIDCYLFDKFFEGNDLARTFSDNVNDKWYKHSQFCYRGELFENHRFFTHTREGKKSKQLNGLIEDSLNVVSFDVIPGTGAYVPPPLFNALFLTHHALTHFLSEGLKLKQILDWAMFLARDFNKIDWVYFYKICDEYHLKRFVDIMNDIAVNWLGVSIYNCTIEINSPYTMKVLDSTFKDKDYVFSSGESGWKNRWHIIKNLFKYRWKYHKVYQHSILKQLWYYTSGFILKTE